MELNLGSGVPLLSFGDELRNVFLAYDHGIFEFDAISEHSVSLGDAEGYTPMLIFMEAKNHFLYHWPMTKIIQEFLYGIGSVLDLSDRRAYTIPSRGGFARDARNLSGDFRTVSRDLNKGIKNYGKSANNR